MRSSGFILLGLTTLVLVLLTVFSALGFSFSILFYLMCFGQLLFIVSVYKVLTGNYTSTKTFDDLYEDYTPDKEN